MLHNTHFADIYVDSCNYISFYISSTFEIKWFVNYYYYKITPNIEHLYRNYSIYYIF